jgi:hypothetical protein
MLNTHAYRAYEIGKDGHVVSRVDLLCMNDEVAKEQAQALADCRQIELWDGACLVARFEPQK